MFGIGLKPDKIAFLVSEAIVIDDFTFEDKKLFIACMNMRRSMMSSGHCVNMKTESALMIWIELKNLSVFAAVFVDQRQKLTVFNIDYPTFGFADRFHRLSL